MRRRLVEIGERPDADSARAVGGVPEDGLGRDPRPIRAGHREAAAGLKAVALDPAVSDAMVLAALDRGRRRRALPRRSTCSPSRGAVLSPRRGVALFCLGRCLAVSMAVHVLLLVVWRYRMPYWDPILILFAVFGAAPRR
jgi:hypothetical protein